MCMCTYINIYINLCLEAVRLGGSVLCGYCDHHCFPFLQVLLLIESSTSCYSSSKQLLSSSSGWAKANGKWWQMKHYIFLYQLIHCRVRVPCCKQLDKMHSEFSTAGLGYGVGDSCLFITVEPFGISSSLVKTDNMSKLLDSSLKWTFAVSLITSYTKRMNSNFKCSLYNSVHLECKQQIGLEIIWKWRIALSFFFLTGVTSRIVSAWALPGHTKRTQFLMDFSSYQQSFSCW